MKVLEKLVRGSWQRKTRLRDEKNNPILIYDLRFIFPAVYEYIKLKLNIPSHLPIINYSAIKIFKTLTKHKKLKVLVKRHGIYRTFSYDKARKSTVFLEDLKLPAQFLKGLKDED